MTEKLYHSEPYLKEFDAVVMAAAGGRVVLDRTAFYPGGGGQQSDLGSIGGYELKGVGREDDEIIHRIPGTPLKPGERVHCVLDWGRRYDLMRGHTGQHILFRAMQEQIPELSVVKVDISPERKSLFFDGDMTWEKLKHAVARANDIILSDLPVDIVQIERGSPELDVVRVKLERIGSEKIRVVRIGDFDAAACGGVHVRSTGEVGGISVTRLVSGAKESDWEIQFETGPIARRSSPLLGVSLLATADILGCAVENVERTALKLKERAEVLSTQLRALSQEVLSRLEPEDFGGFKIYSALVSGADRRTVNEVASSLVQEEGGIVLICDVSDDGIYLVVGCNEKLSIDCPSLLSRGLGMLGGRGGGKRNFAMGGASDASRAEEAFSEVRRAIMELLETEMGCG